MRPISSAGNNGKVQDNVKLRGTVGLVNAYWDILPRGHFTPYIGAGIGFVYNNIERSYRASEDTLGNLVFNTVATGSSSAVHVGLAAALMAGVSFATDHRFVWDLSYRALYTDGADTGTTLSPTSAGMSSVDIGNQWEHQIRIGIRANIW